MSHGLIADLISVGRWQEQSRTFGMSPSSCGLAQGIARRRKPQHPRSVPEPDGAPLGNLVRRRHDRVCRPSSGNPYRFKSPTVVPKLREVSVRIKDP